MKIMQCGCGVGMGGTRCLQEGWLTRASQTLARHVACGNGMHQLSANGSHSLPAKRNIFGFKLMCAHLLPSQAAAARGAWGREGAPAPCSPQVPRQVSTRPRRHKLPNLNKLTVTLFLAPPTLIPRWSFRSTIHTVL